MSLSEHKRKRLSIFATARFVPAAFEGKQVAPETGWLSNFVPHRMPGSGTSTTANRAGTITEDRSCMQCNTAGPEGTGQGRESRITSRCQTKKREKQHRIIKHKKGEEKDEEREAVCACVAAKLVEQVVSKRHSLFSASNLCSSRVFCYRWRLLSSTKSRSSSHVFALSQLPSIFLTHLHPLPVSFVSKPTTD